MKATVGKPKRLANASGGARVYRFTVTGFDIPSHRRLATAAARSLAHEHGWGRAALVRSSGTHENGHGVSRFTYRIAVK